MNKYEADVLKTLYLEPFINQRVLADLSGYSLGVVNRSLKSLITKGYLDEQIKLTSKAKAEMALWAPKNAVILAAGFGMRMVPINTQSPKALLEVNGETIIERTIKQLHEIGVTEIYNLEHIDRGYEKFVEKLTGLDKTNDAEVRELVKQARDKKIKVEFVEKRVLDKMSETGHHQGVIATYTEFEYSDLDDVINNSKKQGKEILLVLLASS